MAKAQEQATPSENKPNKYRDGRWSLPNKRAKGYAEERKEKVHKWGNKEGKKLTDYEAGMRSGYLQCQNDHGGMFKYGQAVCRPGYRVRGSDVGTVDAGAV